MDDKALAYELPDRHNFSYMVYAVSSSILEIPKIRKMPYLEVYKYMCYKRFDSWAQKQKLENKDDG